MKKILLADGGEILIKPFQPKNENLIKVRLHIDDECGEGIWVCLPDEAIADYKADVLDTKPIRYGTLRNDSINIGMGSWGLLIPIKFNGDKRPECNLSWIKEGSDMIFNLEDTLEEKV